RLANVPGRRALDTPYVPDRERLGDHQRAEGYLTVGRAATGADAAAHPTR
ncbi:MAG: hypothetical protein RLZZ88_152, partial [Actinomycetota bacterium]